MLFYPWGDIWQADGGGGLEFAALPYRDSITNCDFTNARVYSPNLGRWLSPDPLGKGAASLDDPQSWNMYMYVRDEPTTLTDPSGETDLTHMIFGFLSRVGKGAEEIIATSYIEKQAARGGSRSQRLLHALQHALWRLACWLSCTRLNIPSEFNSRTLIISPK